jgi:GAF domain-containing protein
MSETLNTEDQRQLAAIAALLAKGEGGLQGAMDYLHAHRPDYHWVGVYRLAGDTLVLGPYQGPRTDHTRIPVGRGVCGTAVAENANQIVANVSAVPNYLACNLDTKSEIVVLVRERASGRILGQIDVDGRRVNQFGPAEEAFLAAVAELLAPALG